MTLSETQKSRCASATGRVDQPPTGGALLARCLLVGALVVASAALIAYPRVWLGTAIVSTHFAYVPIVLASLWWGRRAVWVAVPLGGWTLALGRIAPTGEPPVADAVRMGCFLLVALAVGLVKERGDAARREELAGRRELEAAREKLFRAERLASMGQLSAGVAHEINNPLGTVLIYSHMLLKELQNDSRHRQDLEMVVNEANRCKGIVRGLLDFARQSRVSKEPTDVAELVDSVIEASRAAARGKGVGLRRDVQDDLGPVMLDRAQMTQALLNLVNNGIDATDEGGEVRVAVWSSGGDKLRIDVSDNGHGIAEEHRSRLFTPFFTTKEREKGTGLGLAIVYGVVKMHSGDISVESEKGKGTTFSIQLPLETERAEKGQETASSVEGKGAHGR